MTDALEKEDGSNHNWLAVTAPREEVADDYVYLYVESSQESFAAFGVPMPEKRALKVITKLEKIRELDFLKFGIAELTCAHRNIAERGAKIDRNHEAFEAAVAENQAKRKRAEALIEAEDLAKSRRNGKPHANGKPHRNGRLANRTGS